MRTVGAWYRRLDWEGYGRKQPWYIVSSCPCVYLKRQETTSDTVAAPWYCPRLRFSGGADAGGEIGIRVTGTTPASTCYVLPSQLRHCQVLTFIKLCEVRSGNFFLSAFDWAGQFCKYVTEGQLLIEAGQENNICFRCSFKATGFKYAELLPWDRRGLWTRLR